MKKRNKRKRKKKIQRRIIFLGLIFWVLPYFSGIISLLISSSFSLFSVP